MPFLSMIWDKKFDSTVKRISGINFDIFQAQELGTGAIMIILRLKIRVSIVVLKLGVG